MTGHQRLTERLMKAIRERGLEHEVQDLTPEEIGQKFLLRNQWRCASCGTAIEDPGLPAPNRRPECGRRQMEIRETLSIRVQALSFTQVMEQWLDPR